MSNTADPIADLLTRIRNGVSNKSRFVDAPASKIKLCIVQLLKDEGLIENFLHRDEKPQGVIRIYLKYVNRKSAITGLHRVSRCGLRRYVNCQQIPRIFGGMGTSIISTSRGLMTAQRARQQNIGGEIMCHVW